MRKILTKLRKAWWWTKQRVLLPTAKLLVRILQRWIQRVENEQPHY